MITNEQFYVHHSIHGTILNKIGDSLSLCIHYHKHNYQWSEMRFNCEEYLKTESSFFQ